MRYLLLISFLLFGIQNIISQKDLTIFFSGCGSDQLMINDSSLQRNQQQLNLTAYNFFQNRNFNKPTGVNTIAYIPVVVHIIHNGGTENISNTQVQTAIGNINSKFAQSNNYQIQFCLAQRDPSGNSTNGITRDVSLLTNETMETEDILLKNINRWPPTCYLNIWIVKAINSLSSGSGVIGYAYLPSAHGQNMDGIVIEADYFGSSSDNDGVGTHEIGHYLGLYHTFQNACTNNNCLLDGDQVCDTPPDQTTFSACIPSANSCNTDNNDPSTNNPFTIDVSDLSDDYMDYSNLNCYTQFTAGQYSRMQFFLTTTRNSLLNCLSCTNPCPTTVIAQITSPVSPTNITTGTSINFLGISSNSSSCQWYLYSSSILSTNTNYSHIFNNAGTYWMKFKAVSSNPSLCLDGIDSVKIVVTEPSVVSCNGSLEFVTAADEVDLPLNNQYYSSNGFTWECWFKLNTPFGSSLRPLIVSTDYVVYEDICLGFGWNLGLGNYPVNHVGFKVDGPNSSTGPSTLSCSYAPPGGFVIGNWYHVAGVMDYSTHVAKLFLNGTLVDTKTVNSDPFSRTIQTRIGFTIPSFLLEGNMDEIRIWSSARMDIEIANNYDKCLAGNEQNLVLYYRCNQSAGSSVIDATANGNDGTIVNQPIWSVQQPTLANSCSNCNDICDNKVSVNKDTVICIGGIANLNASSGFDYYHWRPSGSLSDSTISSPLASPVNTTTYVVTATKMDTNLIINGDFSLGNIGFSTNYNYCNTGNCLNPLVNDGYSIGANPNFYHFAFQGSDHTSGSGNMMIVNGSNPTYDVWSQTINVLPSQDYSFSVWASSVYSVNPAQLEFFINNVSVGILSANVSTNVWDQFNYLWNSGSNNSVTLSIKSILNTPGYSQNGNDFGLDDISFRRVCFSSDTVDVVVRNKVIPNLDLGNDTAMCENSIFVFNAGAGFLDYTWNDGSKNMTYTAYSKGKYWITVKDSCGAFHSDTIKVDLLQYPLLDLGNDIVICNGDSSLLSYTPANTFTTFQWSPTLSLSCSHCSNPQVNPSSTTKYYLTATTVQGCTVSDSILITVGQNLFSGIRLDVFNPICGATNGEIRINDLDNSFAPYQFNFNQAGYTSMPYYLNLGGGNYTIQIKDNVGCIFDTTAVLLSSQLDETVVIPNCFSPNGDGINDTWYISGTCIQTMGCKIFNRWGEQVKSISSVNESWDGKYKGEQVPDGVYFYVLEIEYYSQESKSQGFISVFR